LNRSTLDAIRMIGADPELKGVHMMGGLSNVGQQLPPKAADGSDLKHCLENAFLTLAVPCGFDTVLGTPWRGYAPLPEDHYVHAGLPQFPRAERHATRCAPCESSTVPDAMSPDAKEFAVVAEWLVRRRTAPRGRSGDLRRPRRAHRADIAAGDHAGADLARRGLAVTRGGFLMPGLVDAHAHLFLDGAPTDAKVRAHLKQPLDELTEAARASARQALACGVTLVRDAGDRHGINNRIREERRRTRAAASRACALRRPRRQARQTLRRLHGRRRRRRGQRSASRSRRWRETTTRSS
jgi:hypothetical protein